VYINIRGPDGTVISKVVKNSTDEPEDHTDQDRSLEEDFKKRKAQKEIDRDKE
jgi:hypothetical protein